MEGFWTWGERLGVRVCGKGSSSVPMKAMSRVCRAERLGVGGIFCLLKGERGEKRKGCRMT